MWWKGETKLRTSLRHNVQWGELRWKHWGVLLRLQLNTLKLLSLQEPIGKIWSLEIPVWINQGIMRPLLQTPYFQVRKILVVLPGLKSSLEIHLFSPNSLWYEGWKRRCFKTKTGNIKIPWLVFLLWEDMGELKISHLLTSPQKYKFRVMVIFVLFH